MYKTKRRWQEFEISSDKTHHLINRQPAYSSRFYSVLTFHEPGLAPVIDETGAFHIDTNGQSAYFDRFLRTFGFYEGKATVQSISGWFPIHSDGSELSSDRYAWCGNFQQSHCVVKDFDGHFFHINSNGKKAYSQSFSYVGDFREGYTMVQNERGLHSHIDFNGHLLHGKWFQDLDNYHKGFARAKDARGWFHIDTQGCPIYEARYKNIEPFYNGLARVETVLGSLYQIDEKGEKIHQLREAMEDEFHQLSAELVSYWRFYTLQSAYEMQIFEHLPHSVEKLSLLIELPEVSTLKLLHALQEMGMVNMNEHKEWGFTTKGTFFHSKHPYSLRNAMELWKEEHLTSWRHLSYSLKTGQAAFDHLFGKRWFDWLQDNSEKNHLYHQTISLYAKKDYLHFCSSIDLSQHRSLMDVGGSNGTLLIDILNKTPTLEGILVDLPQVIQLVEIPENLKKRMKLISADFFKNWPTITTESALLARVLHDWSDKEALEILKKIYSALSDLSTTRLYIIENLLDETTGHGALLNLNMLVMTGGTERTLKQFKNLLKQGGFILESVCSLNQVSSILVAKKAILSHGQK